MIFDLLVFFKACLQQNLPGGGGKTGEAAWLPHTGGGNPI